MEVVGKTVGKYIFLFTLNLLTFAQNVLRSTLVYLDTLHLVPQGQLGIK